jgi:hypothetical protein
MGTEAKDNCTMGLLCDGHALMFAALDDCAT